MIGIRYFEDWTGLGWTSKTRTGKKRTGTTTTTNHTVPFFKLTIKIPHSSVLELEKKAVKIIAKM